MVAVLGVATVVGCKKKEVIEDNTVEVVDKKEQALIKELKIFYSSLTNIPADSLEYNPKTQQFVWKGVNQLSREQLLLAYEQYQYSQKNN